MSRSLDDLPADSRRRLAEVLLGMLGPSPFARRTRWRDAVVVLHPERREVVHRQALAAEFQAAGLVDAAHECVARRLRAGEVLVHILRDDDEAAGAAFLVVDVFGTLRARADEKAARGAGAPS